MPYEKQLLGIMAPNILREVGDVPHLAALVAPRRLTIVGAVHGNGKALTADELEQNFKFIRRGYQTGPLAVLPSADIATILHELK